MWKGTDEIVQLNWEDGKISGTPTDIGEVLAKIADACIDMKSEGVFTSGKASETPMGFYLFCEQELVNPHFIGDSEEVFDRARISIPEDAIG